jgi:acetyltransferase-like isoleucine patch superfamily enzyme
MRDRSVLAARAALFTDTETDGVYRGNPAQLIKRRVLRDQ